MEFFTPWHIIIVVAVGAMLYFGGDKLPDLARSVGHSLRVFKKEIKGLSEDDDTTASSDDGRDADASVEMRKAIEAPAAEQAPRVVAAPSEPIPVQAEVVRGATPAQQRQDSRPRPRPAGSGARK